MIMLGMVVAQRESVAADPEQLVFPVVYLGGIWLLGRGARVLTEQSTRLRELNAALLAERENRAALAVAEEAAPTGR